MSWWYSDERLILNLAYLVEAYSHDGDEELDGVSMIVVTTRSGERKTHTSVITYPDQPARDAALLALGSAIHALCTEEERWYE